MLMFGGEAALFWHRSEPDWRLAKRPIYLALFKEAPHRYYPVAYLRPFAAISVVIALTELCTHIEVKHDKSNAKERAQDRLKQAEAESGQIKTG